MKRLALALALMMSAPAWGATYYVTQTGAGTTDGTTEANAFAGWSDIPGNTFVAGDVLCVVGQVSSAAKMSFTDNGVAGNPVIIRGDCTGNPGILDGQNTAAPVLQLGEAGLNASYVRMQNITVRNSDPTSIDGDCIRDSSLGAGGGFNEFINVTATDCGMYAIRLQKPNPTIIGGEYSHCGDDCIHLISVTTNPTIRGALIEYISERTTDGDGIGIYDTAGTSNVLIEDVDCYWDFAGKAKSCFIVGVASGSVVIRNNRLIARVPITENHAISVTAGTTVDVTGNWCDGWDGCVAHYNVTAEGVDSEMNVRSNVARGSLVMAEITPSVGSAVFRVENNSGSNLRAGLFASTTATPSLVVRNNTFRLAPGSTGDALYVSANYASYTGSNNNFGPEAAGFIENYECGGAAYATMSAYVAACTQEVGTTALDPRLVGGANPTTPEGFRPGPDSPLCAAGTAVNRGLNDFRGVNFAGIPAIGAIECGVPRVSMGASNRVEMTSTNRVEMGSTNRVTRTEATTVRLQ